MSTTAKKHTMRGSSAGEIPTEDQEPTLNPEDLEEFDLESEPQELDEYPQEDEVENPLDQLPAIQGATEEENGDWVYTLQHPPRSPLSFSKVRIPKNIFAKDIRRSTQGRNDGETIFYMLCSVSRIPAKMMDLVDARDYSLLAMLMQRRALGNSRAVLRSLGGEDKSTE